MLLTSMIRLMPYRFCVPLNTWLVNPSRSPLIVSVGWRAGDRSPPYVSSPTTVVSAHTKTATTKAIHDICTRHENDTLPDFGDILLLGRFCSFVISSVIVIREVTGPFIHTSGRKHQYKCNNTLVESLVERIESVTKLLYLL